MAIHRFGRGYQLELKLQEPEAERISNVSNYATRFFDQNGRLPLSDLETCAEVCSPVSNLQSRQCLRNPHHSLSWMTCNTLVCGCC